MTFRLVNQRNKKKNRGLVKDGIPSKGQFVPTLVLVFIKKKHPNIDLAFCMFVIMIMAFSLFVLQREIHHIFPSMGYFVF